MSQKAIDINNPNLDSRVKSAVSKIPELRNVTKILPMEGGLTNLNFRIDTDDASYFLRLSEPRPEWLGINRDHEKMNTEFAYQAGVGPKVIAYLQEEKILLINWIDAITLHAEDFHAQENILSKIAAALQQLHTGPKFAGPFHFPSIRKKYLQTVRENNFYIPQDYFEVESQINALEKIILSNPEPLVPCNNDLLAENFMDDGNKIWIIDYEYAGENEASFEIGNLASEISFSEAEIIKFCNAYWGKNIPSKIFRAMAWSLIARFGWVMWASIQESISTIPFDFKAWGMSKWSSVLDDLNSDRYNILLKNLKDTN